MDAPHPGGLGGTYSANPLACVAAIEAMNTISDPAFLDRSAEIGRRLRSRLEQIASAHPELVGDVRGLGSMLVMELVHDGDPRRPWMEATAEVTAATCRRGVITIRAGLYSNCVRFLPPLVITDDQLDEALDVVEDAVREISERFSA